MLRIGIRVAFAILKTSVKTSYVGEKKRRYFTKILKSGIVTASIPKRNDTRKFPLTFSHSPISCTWYIVSSFVRQCVLPYKIQNTL